MSPKQIAEKTVEQVFNKDKITGLDVTVWLMRHIGWLLSAGIFFSGIGAIAYSAYFKPKIECIARDLDAPILDRVNENTKMSTETYYKTAKIEYILKKTSPKKVVKEAEEWLEIEKWKFK